jgi:hypothetical protein
VDGAGVVAWRPIDTQAATSNATIAAIVRTSPANSTPQRQRVVVRIGL